MKKIRKILLWILGIIMWLSFLTTFIALEIEHQIHVLTTYLILSSICLAIYIFRKTGSGTKELEKENQELKAEIQKLQQELAGRKRVSHIKEKCK